MKYLNKNLKGMLLLIFLLATLVGVNQVISLKEINNQTTIFLLLNDIERSCFETGKTKLNNATYTCIPANAI